jgi:tRNA (guanine37-N1)-methyltransferase
MTRRLKDDLAGVLSDEERRLLVGAYDVVGDIAIIIVPEPLVAREEEIARAILAGNRRIKVVAKRDGIYGGEFRTIPLKILAGENRKETEVREFGLRLRLNPETVYYSVRSGNERRRIAALVKALESVLVLFSGIAPYPLVISRFSAAREIVGIEKNPAAHAYAAENLRLNRKQTNISLHLGDVREALATLATTFDRVVMPLPTAAEQFLPIALKALRPSGVLHYYALQRIDLFSQAIVSFTAACQAQGRTVKDIRLTRCGHSAPGTFRICLDAVIA